MGVTIESFFVVTNGSTGDDNAKRLAIVLLDLYSKLSGDRDVVEDLTSLVVSGDMFHDSKGIPQIYRGLRFFDENPHGPKDERSVINTGRAYENGIGSRMPVDLGPIDCEKHGEDYLSAGLVYVSANGNIVSDCDQSYEDIDEYARGNLMKESLQTILLRDARDE